MINHVTSILEPQLISAPPQPIIPSFPNLDNTNNTSLSDTEQKSHLKNTFAKGYELIANRSHILKFKRNKLNGEVIIDIIDIETHNLIKQVPSLRILQLAAASDIRINYPSGLFLNVIV